MITIELSVTMDNSKLTGKIKCRAEKATLPQMCAAVEALTEIVIENFEISEDLRAVIGYFVAREMLQKYKKNVYKEVIS